MILTGQVFVSIPILLCHVSLYCKMGYVIMSGCRSTGGSSNRQMQQLNNMKVSVGALIIFVNVIYALSFILPGILYLYSILFSIVI